MPGPFADDVHDLTLDLANAVSLPELWVPALEKMAGIFGGNFATFELIEMKSGRSVEHFDSSDVEVQDDYLNHFMPLNPRIAFGSRPGAPSILHDHLLISERGMDADPFYMDFLRGFDLRYFFSFKALETPDIVGVFTVQRSARAGPANREELGLLRGIGGSLQNVAKAQLRYSGLLSKLRTLDAVFEKLPVGVIRLGRQGRVLEINRHARAICTEGDGLSLAGGRLWAEDQHAQSWLNDAVARLRTANSVPPLAHLFIQRSSGLPPYRLTIEHGRMTADRLELADSVLVFLDDPCREIALDIEQLKDGFGLTKAEARVALMITKGHTASEIAASGGVSIATVRTQVQRVLHKAGVRRQSDLARIVSRYI